MGATGGGRGVRTALVALVAAVALSACAGVRPTLGAEVVTSDGRTRASARVAVVGDSLTVGEYATLPRMAESRGLRLDVSAESGRRVASGADELHRLAADHDVFVVALGTNDAEPGLTAEQAGALIDGALWSVTPDATVLWLTVHRPASDGIDPASSVFNDALRAASSRHQGLVVLDWAGVVASRPELVGEDGIHLTADGYAVRSAWLVDRVVEHLPVPG